jgi:hypothetical protein
MIGVTSLFSTPQQIVGFASDAAFSFADADRAETVIGVDGIMSGGWIPRIYSQTITLQANSASIAFFETWGEQEEAARELLTGFGTITYPGVGRKYSLPLGYLKGYIPLPEAAKTLKPRTFRIDWSNVSPASM